MVFFVLMSFDIISNERFPSSFDGILVPDDGVEVGFRNGIENYYGCETPLVGVFISEYVTTAEVPFIVNGVELANLKALITFGIHMDLDRLDETHLGILARDLSLPLLHLKKPKEYPDYDSTLQDRLTWLHEVHRPGWVQNNPLVALYHRNVHIELNGDSATFRPAEK